MESMLFESNLRRLARSSAKYSTWLAILTVGLFSFSGSAWAQISLVHVTSCGPGAFPATTCTIPSTGSGNLIVVAFASINFTPTITSVTDNAGNTYVEAGSARAVDSAANEIVDVWYAKNSKSGATTVTITPSASGTGAAMIWEFSNVDTGSPLDQTTVLNSQPAATTPLGASVTTTAPNEVIVSVMSPVGTITGPHSGNAFISDSLFFGVGWAHLVTSSTGTYAAQWDITSGTYASSTVSFRAAASSTPSNTCDLASPYGTVDSADVQAAVNMSLGLAPCTANILGIGVCNVVVVQRVINAMGGTCTIGNSHTVSLAWVASTSSNVSGYKVYRATTSGGPYTILSTSLVNGTSYTDSTVQAGQTYYYVVSAVDVSSNESVYSNEAQAAVPFP